MGAAGRLLRAFGELRETSTRASELQIRVEELEAELRSRNALSEAASAAIARAATADAVDRAASSELARREASRALVALRTEALRLLRANARTAFCGIDDAAADAQLLAAGGPPLEAAVGEIQTTSEKLCAIPPAPITPLPPRNWLCCTNPAKDCV